MTTNIFALKIASFAGFVLSLGFSGCSVLPKPKVKTPTLQVHTIEGSDIQAKGDAQTPASVTEGSTRTETLLPVGSKIEVVPAHDSEPAKTVVTLAAAVPLVSITRSTAILAPKSFPPEAGPTLSEVVRGKALLGAYGLAGLLLLVGFGMLYLQHYKAGGFLLLGAVLVPVAANLLTNSVALVIGAICAAIGLTLYGAWHLIERKRDQKTANV